MIVCVVLVSTMLLSFVSYKRAKNSISSQLELNYSIAADKYAQELTAWMNTNATIIDTLASQISVTGIYDDGYDAFHDYLERSYNELNDNGYIYDIYFTHPDNTMTCASDFLVDGTVDYVHDRAWYREAVRTGELFYSTPYMDSDTRLPIITISRAVYDNGEVQGVLSADIFVDTLVDIINEADVASNSYAFLVDQNLGMIVHPNEAYDFDDEPYGVMAIEGAPYEEVVRNMLSDSDDAVYIVDYDGISRGVVVSRMSNTGWYVGIAISEEEIVRQESSLIRGFLIASVVAVLIGCLISVFSAIIIDKLVRQQQEHEAQVLLLEKQAADAASKAKSRFLADMSHEIRTPINAILGMNEMVLREAEDDEIKGYARNIKQSGHNLLQLVNSILDFSKIEENKVEIVPVRYSVGEQIAYLVNGISEKARAKNLELNFDIDPNIPAELYGDDTRINEVIMNLLTNAVKYTEKGSVNFSMKLRARKDDGKISVRIDYEVKDTGIGIKESDMDKLFESFERLDVERNRNIEGTGLGMAITTRLLALMGSELKVQSTYGEGSTFSFSLWQRIETEFPLGNYKKAIRAAESKKSEYKALFRAPKARILAVDDTEINLVVVEKLLKQTRVQVDKAMSGPEAIELCRENKYDVILMDQRMPEMDGTEAMKKIKALEEKTNESTPVICLTADVISGARERYIGEGFTDYLTKPIDGTELEKMLFEYLSESVLEKEDGKEEEPAEKPDDSEFLSKLEEAGINTEKGLYYCMNDADMYKDILGTFAEEYKEKSVELQKHFGNKDWKNYSIFAHSLKSSAKTIGAMTLSELAKDLEKASNNEDAAAIETGHGELMKLYQEVSSKIILILQE